MINKLKIISFNFLRKIQGWLSGTGISRIPGVFWIYDLFFRHSWPYEDIIEIQGSKMYINVKDEDPNMRKTFQGYALNRVHEKSTTELFKQTVKEGDTVVDLGANIGYFTLLAAKLVGEKGKVFAFEPEPKNYNYLLKNIAINNYKNVVALQKAVSDKNGKTKLYICDYDSGHHTINRPGGLEAYSRGREIKIEEIDIETIRLDEFFKGKEELIDVIKMDVEGAEALVLAGMDNILKKNKKLRIFTEFFPLLIKKMESSPSEFLRKLIEDYGFSISVIPDDYDAKKGEMVRAVSVDEVMGFCRGEEDHINLFLEYK